MRSFLLVHVFIAAPSSHGKWQRRYFVLHGTVLYYYKLLRDVAPLGTGDLSAEDVYAEDASAEHPTKTAPFLIRFPWRVMYFDAPNEKNRDEWIKAVNIASGRLPPQCSDPRSEESCVVYVNAGSEEDKEKREEKESPKQETSASCDGARPLVPVPVPAPVPVPTSSSSSSSHTKSPSVESGEGCGDGDDKKKSKKKSKKELAREKEEEERKEKEEEERKEREKREEMERRKREEEERIFREKKQREELELEMKKMEELREKMEQEYKETLRKNAEAAREEAIMKSVKIGLGLIRQGALLKKYAFRKGKPAMRFFCLQENDTVFRWGPKRGKYTSFLDMKDVEYVVFGARTKAFRTVKNPPSNTACCFSIVSKDRTLDLEAANTEQCMMWYIGFQSILKDRMIANGKPILSKSKLIMWGLVSRLRKEAESQGTSLGSVVTSALQSASNEEEEQE
eukprot:TRINITY_DN57158_c0_g1_i1.p1 TRINITY_DN57158_c0_g1~~TRINITY_DN57158_c0_g1_i1.p1  ORF type:complete len:454 (-),score=173.28 TRINITY_DN57158_c0_g1_i1:940-2301(-)